MEYDSPIPLSDAATNHLIRFPKLHTLYIRSLPPNYSTSPFSLVFPSLKDLTIGEGAASEWLLLFERLENCGSAPLSKAKESMKSLDIENLSSVLNIDTSFVSPIQRFRNLVDLLIENSCRGGYGGSHCTFRLGDGNVTELVMALTQLEILVLGRACFENTCATTVACLLPISVHCVKLRMLAIHFNTTSIVENFKNTSEDPRFQELCSLPRCQLTSLDVHRIPLTLDELGLETVARGMIGVFPSLTSIRCSGFDQSWYELSDKIAYLQQE